MFGHLHAPGNGRVRQGYFRTRRHPPPQKSRATFSQPQTGRPSLNLPLHIHPSKTQTPSPAARLAILGASGYTGAEAVRLVANHPGLTISALTGESNAGKPFADVFPHLGSVLPPSSPAATLTKIGDVDWGSIDAAFCCLPHATTQATLASLPSHIKVVDLSADFRLKDPAVYEEWYGTPHAAVGLQAEAVYGLTELAREEVKGARLVANPGCYPTASQLPLIPLVEAGLIQAEGVIIDAKSGVSGAGRSAKVNLLYTEVRKGGGEGNGRRRKRESGHGRRARSLS